MIGEDFTPTGAYSLGGTELTIRATSRGFEFAIFAHGNGEPVALAMEFPPDMAEEVADRLAQGVRAAARNHGNWAATCVADALGSEADRPTVPLWWVPVPQIPSPSA